ncbi:MAG: hypothetical protein GF364_03430 [Candidatus Lokiarchaeota archaeon]|nr:hypothetical protein [Candidatus Lokiarchaeota archaeon]
MGKKDLKLTFDKLMMQWESEANDPKLRPLSDNQLDYYLEFQQMVHKQEEEKEEFQGNVTNNAQKLIKELKINACNMVDFFINDLLDIRQQKIVDTCQTLNLLDELLLTSAEKDFNRNLTSAFKGYNKMRNIYSVIMDSCHSEPETAEEEDDACIVDTLQGSPKKTQFVFITAIKNIPSLVGSDSIIYGPFKQGEFALIPKINAKILNKEGMANIFS